MLRLFNFILCWLLLMQMAVKLQGVWTIINHRASRCGHATEPVLVAFPAVWIPGRAPLDLGPDRAMMGIHYSLIASALSRCSQEFSRCNHHSFWAAGQSGFSLTSDVLLPSTAVVAWGRGGALVKRKAFVFLLSNKPYWTSVWRDQLEISINNSVTEWVIVSPFLHVDFWSKLLQNAVLGGPR